VLLAKAGSRTFNLSHCWVCGGPPGLSSWPWTSTPLTPAQIVSNYSDTTNDTWGNSETWPIQFPTVGLYCLNCAQEGGIHVGESKCKWTLTLKLVDKDRGVRIWMWLDEIRCSRGFKGYWSNKNETFFLQQFNYYPCSQVCEWKNNSGTWYYTGRINDSPTEFFSPFDDKDVTHFQSPRQTAGPFDYGTRAKRGHYWICGHTAYKHLLTEWSGTCYVGIIQPIFFLLPEAGRPCLGIRLYDDLGDRRVAHKM